MEYVLWAAGGLLVQFLVVFAAVRVALRADRLDQQEKAAQPGA